MILINVKNGNEMHKSSLLVIATNTFALFSHFLCMFISFISDLFVAMPMLVIANYA